MTAKFGIGVFLLVVLLMALGVTYTPSANILFLGIVLTGAGVGLLYIARKWGGIKAHRTERTPG